MTVYVLSSVGFWYGGSLRWIKGPPDYLGRISKRLARERQRRRAVLS